MATKIATEQVAAEGSATDPTESDELRAVDGRVPGRRGLATRARLLEQTRELLYTTSYRDLKVVDIAARRFAKHGVPFFALVSYRDLGIEPVQDV